jgi:hypothetical protein
MAGIHVWTCKKVKVNYHCNRLWMPLGF